MKRRFLKLFIFCMGFIVINNVLGVIPSLSVVAHLSEDWNLIRDPVFALQLDRSEQVTNYKTSLDSLVILRSQLIKNLEKIFMCKNYWELRYYSPTFDDKVADFVFNSKESIKQKVEKLDAIKVRYSIYLGKVDEIISSISSNDTRSDLINEADFCLNSFFAKNIYPGTLEYQREFNLFSNFDLEQRSKVIEDNKINIMALKIYSKSLLKEFDVPNYFKRNWIKTSFGGTGLALSTYLVYKNKDSIQNSFNSLYANFKDLKTAEYYKDILEANIQNTANEISKKFEADQNNKVEDKKWELNDLLDFKKKMLNVKYDVTEDKIKNELNFIENENVEKLLVSMKNYFDSLNDKELRAGLTTGTSFVGGLIAKMINGVTGDRLTETLEGVDLALAEFFKTLAIANDGLNKIDDLKNKVPDIIELHYLFVYRIIADQLGNVVHISNIAKNTIFGVASVMITLWLIKKILTTHQSKIKDINLVEKELHKVLLKYKHNINDVYFDSLNYKDKGLFIYYIEKLQNLSNGILGQSKVDLIKLIESLKDNTTTVYEKVNLIKLEQNSMLVGV